MLNIIFFNVRNCLVPSDCCNVYLFVSGRYAFNLTSCQKILSREKNFDIRYAETPYAACTFNG